MCTREELLGHLLHVNAVRLQDGNQSQNGLGGNELELIAAHVLCPEQR